MTPVPQSRASEGAVEAAMRDLLETKRRTAAGLIDGVDTAAGLIAFDALEAAHDPALGLDRSVRLGDVVEFLRENARHCVTTEAEYFNRKLADRIERTFTASSSSKGSPDGD